MYSFYGGRPGNSFTIVRTFKSIADMVEKFRNGPDYTVVHYDEHVLINTDNKNDADNGKIFRRGYDYKNEDTGGAIYIGQIVGPAGASPDLEFTNYDDIRKEPNSMYASGEFSIDNDLVPGYYKKSDNEEVFNDEIQWKTCSIKNANNEKTTAKIGFKIPYLVIDWKAHSVDSNVQPSISEDSNYTGHPFYKKWDLAVPKGIHGTSFSELKKQEYNPSEDIKNVDGSSFSTTNGKPIITYKQTSYEDNPSGETIKKYLGNYNIIEDITEENGIITIKCTDNTKTKSFNIKTLKEITHNENGVLTFIFYDENDNISITLKQIKEIKIENDKLVCEYTTGNEILPMRWIKSAEIKNRNASQYLYLNWVGGEEDEEPISQQLTNLSWITKLNLTDNGILQATWNDGVPRNINENKKITWVKSISYDKDEKSLNWFSNINNIPNPIIRNFDSIKEVQLDENGILKFTFLDDQNQVNIDIQSLINNSIYTQQSSNNLKWGGVGQINIDNNNYKLNFVVPLSQYVLGSNISVSNIPILKAVLITDNSQISFESLSTESFSIEKTLTGLDFTIDISIEDNTEIQTSLIQGTLVNVFISDLDLSFS